MIKCIYNKKIIFVFAIFLILISAFSCKQKGNELSNTNNTQSPQGSTVSNAKNPSETSNTLTSKSPKISDSLQNISKTAVKTQAKLPKLLDLGADKCIPCKMMKPILDELKTEYTGKLDVEFIDVWENPKESEKYGIKLIPTQIFYDPEGKEFQRHEGFISKEDILNTFKQKGMKLD
jgi:thioredoxin 1